MAASSAPASRSGMFKDVPQMPPTVIFHLTARYNADLHPRKLNLGVGAYRDEALRPYVFSAVRAAEAAVIAAGGNKEYLPITGLPAFTRFGNAVQSAAAKLMFGEDSPVLAAKRVGTCQTLSGTGALTVAAHFLRRAMPGRRVVCSDTTWENHGKVVADAGLGKLESYRYWDAATNGLAFEGMCEDVRALPEGSIVMLHACAHNPTGVDPTREQWEMIADIVAERKLLPWFDCAYQGFASGDPEEDAWAVRMFARRGMDMIVCQSFAKNFGLYCERVGALHVVAGEPASATACLSLLETIIRPMYSNPPAHGARVVAQILNDTELNKQWRAELLAAMQRVKRMRTLLRDALEAKGTPGTWEHITRQIGMFSYTGLTVAQSERMVEEFHVYMLNTGRINVAGLNEATVPILADAIHAVVTTAPTAKL